MFVRIAPAQDMGSIDYYQHYPGFHENPASWPDARILRREGNAKTVVVVPVLRVVPVPVRRADVPRFVVPGTAAQDERPAP